MRKQGGAVGFYGLKNVDEFVAEVFTNPDFQAALRDISEERGEIDLDWLKEKDPEEAREWLVKLRGVGPKTAAIVMVFA